MKSLFCFPFLEGHRGFMHCNIIPRRSARMTYFSHSQCLKSRKHVSIIWTTKVTSIRKKQHRQIWGEKVQFWFCLAISLTFFLNLCFLGGDPTSLNPSSSLAWSMESHSCLAPGTEVVASDFCCGCSWKGFNWMMDQEGGSGQVGLCLRMSPPSIVLLGCLRCWTPRWDAQPLRYSQCLRIQVFERGIESREQKSELEERGKGMQREAAAGSDESNKQFV